MAAIAFTGCMNDNNEEYKQQQQVLPGISIYNSTMFQQDVSMQMAGAGMRLASLLAEARKQNPETELSEIDLSTIQVNAWNSDRPLQLLLFGPGATVTRESETTWRITYPKEGQQATGYYLEGSLVVNTNGHEQLADATMTAPWQVSIQPDFGIKANSTDGFGGSKLISIDMNGGITNLYRDEFGSYVLNLEMIKANFTESKEYSSDWSGQLTVKPEEGESLAFSEIWDQNLLVTAYVPMYQAGFWGPSFYADMTGTGSLGMSYKLTDGVYRFGTRVASSSVGVYAQIVGGTQTCAYSGGYDSTLYPSGTVEYKWTYDNKNLSYTIFYNGHTYTI